jgi:hypothetical protein
MLPLFAVSSDILLLNILQFRGGIYDFLPENESVKSVPLALFTVQHPENQ